MKTAAIFYSFTGNNENLAENIAEKLPADLIKITEPVKRTIGKITTDALFNRIPQVDPDPEKLAGYDLILFFGPVWMGQVSFPLRAYLKYLRKNPKNYVFISISGGPDKSNPKLENELINRTGKKPSALINLFIADLLPAEPKPAPKDIESYILSEKDISDLTRTVMNNLHEIIAE